MSNEQFNFKINSGPAKGLKFGIKLPEDKTIWTGTYELEFCTELAREIKNNSICYDIGGFKGFIAGLMMVNGADHVYTFEPLAENYFKILEMIKLNNTLKITALNFAIGAFDGIIDFNVTADPSMGKIEGSHFKTNSSIAKIKKVEIFTLDTLIYNKRFLKPDILKIDVEGAELDVLSGAKSILTEIKPLLFIEVHGYDIGKQVVTLLDSYNYTIQCLETNNKPDFIAEPEISHYICKKN